MKQRTKGVLTFFTGLFILLMKLRMQLVAGDILYQDGIYTFFYGLWFVAIIMLGTLLIVTGVSWIRESWESDEV